MTRDELDRLWFEAMEQSIRDGEQVVRYHFAALVAAAEREACAKVCEQRGMVKGGEVFAARIRARSNT